MMHINSNSAQQSAIYRHAKRSPSLRSRDGSHKAMRDSSSNKARSTQPQIASGQSDFGNTLPGTGSQFGNVLEDPVGIDVRQNFHEARKHFCDVLNCRYRNKSFSSHNDLIRHKKTRHRQLQDGDELWRCPVTGCKKSHQLHARLDNFKQHIIRVHGEQYLDEAIRSTVTYRQRKFVSRTPDATAAAGTSPPRGSGQLVSLSSGENSHVVQQNTNSTSANIVTANAAYRETHSMYDMHQLFPPASHIDTSSLFSPASPTKQYRIYANDELLSLNGDDNSTQPSHSIFGGSVFTLADSEGTVASSFGTSVISGPQEPPDRVMGEDFGVASLALNRPSTPKLQIETNPSHRDRRCSHVSSASQDNGLLSPYYRPRTARPLSSSSPVISFCDYSESSQCSPETGSDISNMQLSSQEEEAAARLAWQILIICHGYAKQCVQPAQSQAGGSNTGRALNQNQAPLGSSNRSNRSRRQGGSDGGGGRDQGRRNGPPGQATASDTGPIPRKWFACPFYKHDYRRYSQENENDGEIDYRKCAIVSNQNVAQLKRHLYERHARPEFYCKHCYEKFDSMTEFVSHLERLCVSPDAPDPYDTPDKMTYETRDLVKKMKRTAGASEEKYWYDIHRVLFPRDGRPDSPYVDAKYCRDVQTLFELFLLIGPEAQMIVELHRQARHGNTSMTVLNVRVIERAWTLVQQFISQDSLDPAAFAQFIGQPSSTWALKHQQRWTANNVPLVTSNNYQVPTSSNAGPATANPMYGIPQSARPFPQAEPSGWNQQHSNMASNAGTSFPNNSNSWNQQDSDMPYWQENAVAGPSTQVHPINQDYILPHVGAGAGSSERIALYTQQFRDFENLGNFDPDAIDPAILASLNMQNIMGNQPENDGDTNMSTYNSFGGPSQQ